jgi:tetratricopeptide (TPR) repeat protein
MLALGCGACATGSNQTLSARLAEGLDPSKEAVEQECAYFYFMWGRNAELTGELPEAREAYEKALVCDLHSAEIMRRLAILLINMDKKREAATWMQRIIDENPEDKESRSFLANLYLSMDQPEKAEEIFQEILAKDPKDKDNRLYLGLLYARQKKFAQARDVLEKLVKIAPDYGAGYNYLARVYTEQGENERARAAYEKALELNWTTLLAFEVAGFMERQRLVDEALKLYRRILEEDETSEVIRTKIITLLLKENRIPEAIAELEELRLYAGDVPKVELNLSRLLVDQKRYAEAIDHLREALAVDPDFDEARILLALVYHEQGDAAAAIGVLEEIGVDSEQYEEATMLMVQLLGQDKKYSAVVALLQKRIGDEESRRPAFYSALAAVQRELRRYDEAAKIYEEAMRLYPEASEIYLEYSVFADERGDSDKALAAMQSLLALKPDDPLALNYIGYTWAERGEQLLEALDYIKRALEQKPEDGYIRDSLGWVLFKLGRFAEAEQELQQALAAEPQDPAINEHLGDLYQRLDKRRQALTFWSKALELYKDEEKKARVRLKIKAAEQR